ncbi:hypothetical protein ABZ816_01380 [Actinosynnema sp. NPDC047251]|uniref:hypothetical protein n=1 Tax=Saccharothrix espanaensis TaxID=103731 RepID=UPI00130ECD2F|nr:hypothetical protein [Saccharothrix espanaensis]
MPVPAVAFAVGFSTFVATQVARPDGLTFERAYTGPSTESQCPLWILAAAGPWPARVD